MLTQFSEQRDIALFDVVAFLPDITGDVVRIQFRASAPASAISLAWSAPAARGHAIEAGDHGDVERRL